MARLKRISFYFILVIIDYKFHLTQAQVSPNDPTAICRALAANNLCEGNTGQQSYPYPGRCQDYFLCTGKKMHSGMCSGGFFFDAGRLGCVPPNLNPLCYSNCDVYLSSLTTAAKAVGTSTVTTTAESAAAMVTTSNQGSDINMTTTIGGMSNANDSLLSNSIQETTSAAIDVSMTTQGPPLPTRGVPLPATTTDRKRLPSTETMTTNTEPPGILINGCRFPVPCTPRTLAGDKDDCNKFFVCSLSGNAWTSESCLVGTRYSADKQACVSVPVCQQGCPFAKPIATTTSSSRRPRTTSAVADTTTRFLGETTGGSMVTTTTTEQKTESKGTTNSDYFTSTSLSLPQSTTNEKLTSQTAISSFSSPFVTTSSTGEITSPVSTAQHLTSQGSTIGDLTSKASTFQELTSQISTVGDVTSQTSTAGDLTSQISTVGDVTSRTSTAGELTSQISMVGDVTSRTSTAGDLTSQMSALSDTTSQMSTFSDATSQFSTIGDTTSYADITTSGEALSTSETVTSTSGDMMSGTASGETLRPTDSTSRSTEVFSTITTTGSVSTKDSPQTTTGQPLVESTAIQETTTVSMEMTTSDSTVAETTQVGTSTTQSTPSEATTQSDTVAMTTEIMTSLGNMENITLTTMDNNVTSTPLDITTTVTSQTTDQMTTEIMQVSTTTMDDGIFVTSCNRSENCSTVGLVLPDPSNCSRYLECWLPSNESLSNEWKITDCQPGELFDAFSLSCTNDTTNATCHEPCFPDGSNPPPLPSQPPPSVQPPLTTQQPPSFQPPQTTTSLIQPATTDNQSPTVTTMVTSPGTITETAVPTVNTVTSPAVESSSSATVPEVTTSAVTTGAESTMSASSSTSSAVTMETDGPVTGMILDHAIIVVSQEDPLEGGPYRLECNFRIVPATLSFRVLWLLGGEVLRNSERISILQATSQQRQFTRLTISQLSPLDTGELACEIQLSTLRSSVKTFSLNVTPKPVVELDILSATVVRGDQLSLLCTAANSSQVAANPPAIVWYRNNVKIDSNGPEVITNLGWSSKLTAFPQQDVTYFCAGQNAAGEGEKRWTSVVVIDRPDNSINCGFHQSYGVNWTLTVAGNRNVQPCPNNMLGVASRKCGLTDTGDALWEEPNLNDCVDQEYADVLSAVERIEGGVGGSERELQQISVTLQQITNVTTLIPPGNLNVSVETAYKLSEIRQQNVDVAIQETELVAMVTTISNLLDEMNQPSWDSVQKENPNRSVSVLSTVDAYREAVAAQLRDGQRISVASEYLVLQAECFSKDKSRDVTFPQDVSPSAMTWIENQKDNIMISKATLDSIASQLTGDDIAVSSSYYKNIEQLLPVNHANDTTAYLNSKVLAMSVYSLRPGSTLQPAVQMAFTQDQTILDNATANCSFWDFNKAMWSAEGCSVVYSNSTYATCQCDHLTNFAVLVTRKPVEGIHAYILSIISIVGCALSVAGMLLTILVYVSIWKHVKSHHAVVLLNLCVALIIANLLFVTGVDKTEPRVACIVVAVLLHYFYMAAFCLMLVEGIQLILYIIYVFHVRRKRETASLIVLGWVIPAIIVGICLGINRTEGYGNENFCWLDPDTWMFWVFIIPAGVIIVINIIILLCVLKRISTSKIHQIDKNRKQKIKSSMWNIVVVMPILGITWIFGVFSVNSDIVAFQYVFAVSNSLQGVFIFIFHALCNKKLKSARHKGRYQVKTPSSVRTQRSRLKSDSSGKNSNKSSKSLKKASKEKKKNGSWSAESPPYDTIPADFMDFETKPPPDSFTSDGRFIIENDYVIPRSVAPSYPDDPIAGFKNPTFDSFSATDSSGVELSVDDTVKSAVGKMNFMERLNSVTEMRTEEYVDVKLAQDVVRFRDSPKSSPRLPRTTPFLTRSGANVPARTQTSFNC